jgi:hypothetical protein
MSRRMAEISRSFGALSAGWVRSGHSRAFFQAFGCHLKNSTRLSSLSFSSILTPSSGLCFPSFLTRSSNRFGPRRHSFDHDCPYDCPPPSYLQKASLQCLLWVGSRTAAFGDVMQKSDCQLVSSSRRNLLAFRSLFWLPFQAVKMRTD